MKKQKIFIVEDEKAHQLLINNALGANFELSLCSSFSEATSRLSQDSYDLFLLDIMLPDGDGFQILKRIREIAQFRFTPVIFLTSKEDIDSKVYGFSLGVDDYIVKPCDPKELRARIESKFKRQAEREEVGEILNVEDLSLNLETQRVSIISGEGAGNHIDLTPLEFKLLLYLVRNKDLPLARQAILDHVWGTQTHVLDRSVDTYVASLRRKLGIRGKYVKSVHGTGYRFSPHAGLKKVS